MVFSCFKQFSLNFVLALVAIYVKEEARLLSDVEKGLILSSDNSINFHAEIWSVLPIFLKYL